MIVVLMQGAVLLIYVMTAESILMMKTEIPILFAYDVTGDSDTFIAQRQYQLIDWPCKWFKPTGDV